MMELRDFLVRAKKQTYANGKVLRVESNRKGSKDYHYEESLENKIFEYHDTYFGGDSFVGEEVVYLNSKKPCWAMNYYGYTDDKNSDEVYEFLKKALLKVGNDDKVLPLRGERKFVLGEFVYKFKSKGSLNRFNGVERIYRRGKLVYKLICHGGVVR